MVYADTYTKAPAVSSPEQMKLPMISIVVPNFNQAAFLGDSLNSILDQEYGALEAIVIDGGSTDHSSDVIRCHEKALAFWCSERDAGHYDAVNKGLLRAQGEIMGFLNSDDRLFPGSLRIVGEIFALHPEVQWLTTLLPAALDLQGNCFSMDHIPGYSKEAFLDGNYGGGPSARWCIQQESTFWRRALWDECGARIRNEISHAGDFDLWGRFFQKTQLYGVTAPLGGFRIREGQRVAQGSVYSDQCARCLREFRVQTRWSSKPLRRTALAAGLFGVPKIGRLLRGAVGYHGRKIVRKNPGNAAASWEIKDYSFP